VCRNSLCIICFKGKYLWLWRLYDYHKIFLTVSAKNFIFKTKIYKNNLLFRKFLGYGQAIIKKKAAKMAKSLGVPQKGKTRPLDFFVFKLAVSFLVCATPMKMENASFSRPRTRGRRRLTFFFCDFSPPF